MPKLEKKSQFAHPEPPKPTAKAPKIGINTPKRKDGFPSTNFQGSCWFQGGYLLYIYITLSMLLQKNKMLIPIIMQQLPRTIRNRQPYENPHRKLKSIPEKHPNFPGIPQGFFFGKFDIIRVLRISTHLVPSIQHSLHDSIGAIWSLRIPGPLSPMS